MLFTSSAFVLFFVVFWPLYLLVKRHLKPRNLLLLVASYVFYGAWDPRFLILVAVSTSIDFVAALGAAGMPVRRAERLRAAAFQAATTLVALATAQRFEPWILPLVAAGILAFLALGEAFSHLAPGRARVCWLALSLGTNLGILAIFKYAGFFAANLAALAQSAGIGNAELVLQITLPVGLSFFTFQAIGRTVDSFRGTFRPSRSLLDYAAYHAFFPQLVAGPIERAGSLMPQFEQRRRVTLGGVQSGAQLFLWGLFLKLVVADNLAPIADAGFSDPASHQGGIAFAAILAFTVQIYGDFAGYSLMARGLARSIGFELTANFNLPYASRTPSEFWSRWHISLSGWLRDYLYIPLGGNRGGVARTCRNLLLVMLIGGFWHGAAWTFVAWGALHGLVLVVYRLLQIDQRLQRNDAATLSGALVHLFAWAVLMAFVMAAWVFFRSRGFEQALAMFSALASPQGWTWSSFAPVLAPILPLALVELWQRFARVEDLFARGPFLLRWSAALATVLAVASLGAAGGQQFLYFDF